MPQMNEVQCAASPVCQNVLIVPADAVDLKPYADAADWSIILAPDEVHFACCKEHAMIWVEANKERIFNETTQTGE